MIIHYVIFRGRFDFVEVAQERELTGHFVELTYDRIDPTTLQCGSMVSRGRLDLCSANYYCLANSCVDELISMQWRFVRLTLIALVLFVALSVTNSKIIVLSACQLLCIFLPFGEAIASRAIFVIVSGSDGRTETLLEPAK